MSDKLEITPPDWLKAATQKPEEDLPDPPDSLASTHQDVERRSLCPHDFVQLGV